MAATSQWHCYIHLLLRELMHKEHEDLLNSMKHDGTYVIRVSYNRQMQSHHGASSLCSCCCSWCSWRWYLYSCHCCPWMSLLLLWCSSYGCLQFTDLSLWSFLLICKRIGLKHFVMFDSVYLFFFELRFSIDSSQNISVRTKLYNY